MDEDWWIVIRKPNGEVHCYHIGVYDEAKILAARVEQGVPDDEVNLPGWDVSVTTGPLHSSILNGAIVHDWT